MKVVLQRVSRAQVAIAGKNVGSIGGGFLVLLGIKEGDNEAVIAPMVEKIINLRVFPDEQEKMNRSLLDVHGSLLIISQFTLYADCRGGRRPSFTDSAQPEIARDLYKKIIQVCREKGIKVEEGEFGAMMDVELVNSGPVTILLDSDDIVRKS